MDEIWKTIKDYEKYEVSNLGQVRNKQTMKILKHGEIRGGYLQIELCNSGKKKFFYVHRLVAEAFIPNPNNFPQINHKDENKKNNFVDNLEWCTASYNVNYGTRNQKAAKKISKKNSKPVLCVETGQIFASTMDVQRKKGYFQQNISSACNGKRKTAYGYHWQYA